VPYTKDISSTEIKRRILDQERNDRDFILNNVKLLPIESLKLYEKYDEDKVNKLVEKIRKEEFFFNPITINEYHIVIDGVNRLEALKRLGAQFVTSLMINYKDVDLAQNIHYKKDGKIVRMSEFGDATGERIEFPQYSKDDIIKMAEDGIMVENGATWHKVRSAVVRLRVPLEGLIHGFDFDLFLKQVIKSGNIRYYPANVYICDEWV
jgi:disulfide oxidoreductase YuzD